MSRCWKILKNSQLRRWKKWEKKTFSLLLVKIFLSEAYLGSFFLLRLIFFFYSDCQLFLLFSFLAKVKIKISPPIKIFVCSCTENYFLFLKQKFSSAETKFCTETKVKTRTKIFLKAKYSSVLIKTHDWLVFSLQIHI